MTPRVMELGQYISPATEYPRKKQGVALIGQHKWKSGCMYSCYHATPPGHKHPVDYIQVTKDLKITDLRIKGKTWMVDDPSHWWTILNHAEDYRGDVLVAGLGLGLIVHALRRKKDVGRIVVVERCLDVIRLIKPLVPECEIVNDDWYRYKPDFTPDGVFFDLYVGNANQLMGQAIEETARLKALYPNATRRILGFHNTQLEMFATIRQWSTQRIGETYEKEAEAR